MESILDDVCFDGSKEIFSSSWGSSRHDGHSGEYPIGQVVADMESVQYPWGEGSHKFNTFTHIQAIDSKTQKQRDVAGAAVAVVNCWFDAAAAAAAAASCWFDAVAMLL